MRHFFDTPKVGEITQGSIFSGAVSALNYDDECYGLVITARCSIEHAKMKSYHYLPVLPFKSWKEKDFINLLKKEVETKYLNQLCSIFDQELISRSILCHESYESIKEFIGPRVHEKRKIKFNESVDALIALRENSCEYETLKSLHPKASRSIIDRLFNHDYMNYYLIDSWDSNIDSYFVILLDEVRSIQSHDFFQIANGLDYTYWIEHDHCSKSDLAELQEQDILYVHSVIKSPFIEHILQRFSYNFCRIGVEDMNTKTIDNIISKYI